ncbi:MAG: hypothetical protein RL235_1146 [Chlamydiota bacterium]|jgi:lipoprotein-anchoring transpeptidase ErfK/SrfK
MKRFFIIGSLFIFAVIALAGWLKQPKADPSVVVLQEEVVVVSPAPVVTPPKKSTSIDTPEFDQIQRLFALDSSKLPIVETLVYTSRVPWLKGRPAWIADYASHYETSRHFIARSLNKKADYLTQKVSLGDRFNVFKRDKKISFRLLVDLDACKLRFYYVDHDTEDKVLLKTYTVSVGRIDPERKSGYLTPIGTYTLGEKVAIYKPGTMGFFQDKKTEMIRIFGTRWIPFDQELAGCTEPAKAYGIHGTPWVVDAKTGVLAEDRSQIGKSNSDGCIRLASEDIEEIFAIVITKPTVIEIVRHAP